MGGLRQELQDKDLQLMQVKWEAFIMHDLRKVHPRSTNMHPAGVHRFLHVAGTCSTPPSFLTAPLSSVARSCLQAHEDLAKERARGQELQQQVLDQVGGSGGRLNRCVPAPFGV